MYDDCQAITIEKTIDYGYNRMYQIRPVVSTGLKINLVVRTLGQRESFRCEVRTHDIWNGFLYVSVHIKLSTILPLSPYQINSLID